MSMQEAARAMFLAIGEAAREVSRVALGEWHQGTVMAQAAQRVVEAADNPMPWCWRCECYHHEGAPCIPVEPSPRICPYTDLPVDDCACDYHVFPAIDDDDDDDLPDCCKAPIWAPLPWRLYAAYNRGGDRVSRGLSWDRRPCPSWDDLPDNVRAKWQDVADYVVWAPVNPKPARHLAGGWERGGKHRTAIGPRPMDRRIPPTTVRVALAAVLNELDRLLELVEDQRDELDAVRSVLERRRAPPSGPGAEVTR